MSLDYKSAGVDKEAGYDTVERIKRYAGATHNARVLGQIGAFGAFYDLSGYRHPILVSGTDGVGTKLKIAFALGKYDTIGIDAVAMCVNDILCHGAAPQYFLDYLACGKLEPEVAADIVKGVADGCAQAGAALIGGETAEMPGFYQTGEYDIAGFAVGVVEKADLIDGSRVAAGDVLIGLPSSGYHSNGYSLLRKIFTDLDAVVDGKSIGEHLLTPTKIYVKPVLAALAAHRVHGLAHITGKPAACLWQRPHRRGGHRDFPAPAAAGCHPRARQKRRMLRHLQHGHRLHPHRPAERGGRHYRHPQSARRRGAHYRADGSGRRAAKIAIICNT